jgi:hypothetical protein
MWSAWAGSGARMGDKNEDGWYIFNPAWSGRWYWPWGGKVIKFENSMRNTVE